MEATPTKAEILEQVREILIDSFELDPGEVVPNAHLIDDLGLDSIDAIDLAVDLERESGLSVKEEDLRSLRVVQDVVDLISRHLDT